MSASCVPGISASTTQRSGAKQPSATRFKSAPSVSHIQPLCRNIHSNFRHQVPKLSTSTRVFSKVEGVHSEVSCSQTKHTCNVDLISAEDLSKQMDRFSMVLDIRSHENWVCKGHVASPVSLSISVDQLKEAIAGDVNGSLSTAKDQPVALVSDDVVAAYSVAESVLCDGLGFTSVFVLEGGFASWQAAGLNIEFGNDCETISMHCPWLEGSDAGNTARGEAAYEELVF